METLFFDVLTVLFVIDARCSVSAKNYKNWLRVDSVVAIINLGVIFWTTVFQNSHRLHDIHSHVWSEIVQNDAIIFMYLKIS